MKLKWHKKRILYTVIKYSVLFALTFFMLKMNASFILTLLTIIIINIILVQIEFRRHLSTRILNLIQEKKYNEAVKLGAGNPIDEIDVRSQIALMIAYYKNGDTEDAVKLIKLIDNQYRLPRRLKRTYDYWKVRIIMREIHHMN